MKINLKAKIEELIQAHHENIENLNKAQIALFEEFGSPDAREKYKADFISESLRNGTAENKAEYQAVDVLLNTKLKAIIKAAKEALIPELSKAPDRTTDYEMKVANALKFIEIEGNDITDDTAFAILKDFLSDYEKMGLFKNVISKKVDIIDTGSGESIFPKTFGKYNQVEMKINAFSDIDILANMLFIYDKQSSQRYISNNNIVSVFDDGYEEMADEDAICNQAEVIDGIVSEFVEN